MATASPDQFLKKPDLVPEIEGLRAIAVLFVVLYHAQLGTLSGGYIGVDIFFVLSGFLISGHLQRELTNTGSIRFLDFYARRARRIVPAMALMLLVALGAMFALLSPLELRARCLTAIAAALSASNLLFAHHSTDYLALDDNLDPLLHTWSLGVEEQFYLVWPLLLFLAWRMVDAPEKRARVLFYTIAAACVVSFGLNIWLTRTSLPNAFFQSPPRAWEFGVGALAVFSPTLRRGRSILSLSGVGLILIASMRFTGNTHFPGWAALLPVAGTVLVLISIGGEQPVKALAPLRFGYVRWLGGISYSWYLWHWPFLVLGAACFSHFTTPWRLVAVLLSLLTAQLSLKLVENPIRFSPRFRQSSSRSVLYAGAVLALCIAAYSGIWKASQYLQTGPGQRQFNAARNDNPIVYQVGCHASLEATSTPDCVFGDTAATDTVVLFGDSHAAQWFPALDALGIEHHFKLISWTKSSCPVPLTPSVHFSAFASECQVWKEDMLRRIAEVHPRLVIVSSSDEYLRKGLISKDTWRAGYLQAISRFRSTGAAVIVFGDTPLFPEDVPSCLGRAAWRGLPPHCDLTDAKELKPVGTDIVRNAVDSLSDVKFIPTAPWVCEHVPCPVQRGGMILYRDDNHITATFSRSLETVLDSDLSNAVGDRTWYAGHVLNNSSAGLE